MTRAYEQKARAESAADRSDLIITHEAGERDIDLPLIDAESGAPMPTPVRLIDSRDLRPVDVRARPAGYLVLRGTAAVVDEANGDGRVVLFGFDPNYRAFTDGTATMLTNAILGPRPDDPFQVVTPRRVRPADAAPPASDRMVLSVRAGAEDEVRELLARYGARADVVRAGGRVGFRVDLGGQSSDEHPWAQELALDAAKLGPQVVAIRLP